MITHLNLLFVKSLAGETARKHFLSRFPLVHTRSLHAGPLGVTPRVPTSILRTKRVPAGGGMGAAELQRGPGCAGGNHMVPPPSDRRAGVWHSPQRSKQSRAPAELLEDASEGSRYCLTLEPRACRKMRPQLGQQCCCFRLFTAAAA